MTQPDPIAVNYHLLIPCDSKCTFCFATFRDAVGRRVPRLGDAKRILDLLAEAGTQKLTFAGGEPTLDRRLGPLLRHARSLGMTTCVVTNGFKLASLLETHAPAIDWVGLSLDSGDEEIQARLGRGHGDHVARVVALAERCREARVRVKLNSVVTRLTVDEDMRAVVRRVAPERWKLFQVLRVVGENDGDVEPLMITREAFEAFVARHQALTDEGIVVVPEDNDAMTDSYAMIDPLGRFYGNSGGEHHVSAPILEVGVRAALAQVGYQHTRLVARGGRYAWSSAPARRLAANG